MDEHEEMLREKELLEVVDESTLPVLDDENGGDDELGDDMKILEDDSVQGFFSHSEPVYCVATDPTNPSLVLCGGGDDKAFEWDLTSGDVRHEFVGHKDSVVDVGYSHDGKFLASAGLDGCVRVYQRSGEVLHVLEGPDGDIEWMHWHASGAVLAAGASDGSIWIWAISASKASVMQVIVAHSASVTCGAFTGDGRLLCSGSEDGNASVWSIRNGQALQTFTGGLFHQGPVVSMSCHPTKPLLLTGSGDGTAKWSSTATGKVLGSIAEHQAAVEAVAFATSNLQQNWAAAGGMDGSIVIFDVDRGVIRTRCQHEDGVVQLLWLSKRPSLLCSASLDATVRVWDARSGECKATFKGHQAPIYRIAVSADERYLVSVADDNVALVFDLGTVKED